MQKEIIKLVTRQSPLALWQAEHVKKRIKALHPDVDVEIMGMVTHGDQWLAGSLQSEGGKGLFVKQLEEALLRGDADIAVHSLKDVPTVLPEGLCLGAFLAGESPYDVLVADRTVNMASLAKGATIGTSSLRRQAQLKRLRPDLHVVPVRGNVQTRLNKIKEGVVDTLVLAEAGLVRLGLQAWIQYRLTLEECLPAGAQGVLAIETRERDTAMMGYIALLDDSATRARVLAERALNQRLGGSCTAPLGIFATVQNKTLHLRARVLSVDGSECLESAAFGPWGAPLALGIEVAEALLAKGAAALLAGVEK